ncbi:MAG: ubiquinol-cytochrome C chaperone family protein [Pseudomonadota bacterium]
MLNTIFNFLLGRGKSHSIPRHVPHALYGAVVAQARLPALFENHRLPDTYNGRFDVMLLHLFLLSHRLKGEDAKSHELSQQVFDLFLDDMDRTMREQGVGDVSVPKRLKKMSRAFYGRIGAYEAALDQENAAELADSLNRNIYVKSPDEAAATGLANYMIACKHHLSRIAREAFMRGELSWPNVGEESAG